jgi:hypothetical protein
MLIGLNICQTQFGQFANLILIRLGDMFLLNEFQDITVDLLARNLTWFGVFPATPGSFFNT